LRSTASGARRCLANHKHPWNGGSIASGIILAAGRRLTSLNHAESRNGVSAANTIIHSAVRQVESRRKRSRAPIPSLDGYRQWGAAMAKDRWVIELILDDPEEARMAYDAIEKLLVEMGEIGTLWFYRRTRDPATRPAGRGDA
jgi:hypothetical protein